MLEEFRKALEPVSLITAMRSPTLVQTRRAWKLLQEIYRGVDATSDMDDDEHTRAIYLIRERMGRKLGAGWQRRDGWKLIPVGLGKHVQMVGNEGVNELIRRMAKDLSRVVEG